MFEPSAGNGLLTIFYREEMTVVNEIDLVRYANLSTQDFRAVHRLDASQPFPEQFHSAFDAVLTNPPFGRLAEVNRVYQLKSLCVACYEREILDYEGHVFAISCCIANMIQDARDRGVSAEPIIREYLGYCGLIVRL